MRRHMHQITLMRRMAQVGRQNRGGVT
jgi:hypothetical protein